RYPRPDVARVEIRPGVVDECLAGVRRVSVTGVVPVEPIAEHEVPFFGGTQIDPTDQTVAEPHAERLRASGYVRPNGPKRRRIQLTVVPLVGEMLLVPTDKRENGVRVVSGEPPKDEGRRRCP